MNKKNLLSIIYLAMIFLFTGCISKPPNALTLQQMLDDYDYMTKVINAVYPADLVNRQIYNIDINKTLTKYRAKITGKETPQQFYELISQSLFACKGNHMWTNNALATLRTRLFFWSYFPEGLFTNDIDNDSIDVNWAYMKARQTMIRSKPGIPLLYYKGNYYSKYPFNIGNQEYAAGMKLLAINNIKVSEIISSLQDYLDCFDYVTKRFYGSMLFPQVGDNFYMLLGNIDLNFEFENADRQIQNIILRANEDVKSHSPQAPLISSTPIVELMEINHFLYIRLPEMSMECRNIIQSKLEKIKDTTYIKAILLDVRYNRGGNDKVWIDIISLLINKNVKLQGKNAYRDTEMVKQCLRKENQIKTVPSKIPFLGNQNFLISSYKGAIAPSSKSLKLDVPLFIITQDVYSSTGGLLSLALANDFIIRIGISNPTSLGKSGNPWFFKLPNSKIIFSIRPSLDIGNCQTLKDTLHCKVDIEINPTLQEILKFYNTSRNNKSLETSLIEADPFFMTIQKVCRGIK